MKVSISDQGYEYSREWPEEKLGCSVPTVEDVVFAALNVISCMFSEESVKKASRQWTP